VHRVSHISISNFRACRSVSLPLEGYTPLVGQNNTGKSSILEAIQWVLKPSALAATDFCCSSEPVEVMACIDGVTPELLSRIPEQRHRTAIQPYCRDGVLWIRVKATSPRAFTAEVWDVDECEGEGVPDAWRSYPTGLPAAVAVLLPEPLFIEAMDDIEEDLGKAKVGTTIKGLLDEVMVPVLEAHHDLKDALATIRGILGADGNNRSAQLREFDEGATDALSSFFPGLVLDLDLKLVDIKEFFKAGDLHVTDKTTNDRRRFDQMGTGAQRAIQMALVRYLAQVRHTDPKDASRRLLLIDEPELYLHPQGIRRVREALQSLSRSGFQVILSTHSPLMLSRENAADTVIVCKTGDEGTVTRQPLRRAVEAALDEAASQSRALFELGNIADVYFSERVVLCEGKTDRRLLRLAYERIYGKAPDLDGIAFVSLGSCADIPKALPVLRAMGIPSLAVADLDFAFIHARAGSRALLDKDGQDLAQAKDILKRLQSTHGFMLGPNGLPTNDKTCGVNAADAWSILAQDAEGQKVAEAVHEDLKKDCVWVWPQGCIECVTGHSGKGETAIVEQENLLLSLAGEEVRTRMPALQACLDWVRTC